MAGERTVRRLVVLVATVVLSASCRGSGVRRDDASASTAERATVAASVAATEATPTSTARRPEPAAPADDGYLYDQARLHTFAIELPEAALATLDADPTAEEYVEGRLTFDGETLERVGVRYKGSVGAFAGCTAGSNPLAPSGPKTCTKLSLKLRIDWKDPGRELHGVRRVLLHSQNLDPSMMHERLGHWLFRQMGVPAPRSTHARVVVNGTYLGVYALTEEIDGRFTRRAFADGTGNLYKEVWPFDAAGTPTPAAAFVAALETNEDDEGVDAGLVTAFAAELVAASPADRPAVIDRWTDREALLTAFVVDRAIRNDDGALHWYCGAGSCAPHNFFWYEDPSARRLWFVPWDLDNAFASITEPATVVGDFVRIADPFGSITNECRPFPFGRFGVRQRSAACDPLLGALAGMDADYDRLRARLLAGPFAPERVDAQLNAWTAQIADAVAEAATLHADAPSVTSWRASVEALRTALDVARQGTGR